MRVGCDVQSVDDVGRALREFGNAYLDRVFTPDELAAHDQGDRALAAGFAAKEAVAKLLGAPDDFDFRDVEISRDQTGAPGVVLHGSAADVAGAAGLGRIHLSVSENDCNATAVAVADTKEWSFP